MTSLGENAKRPANIWIHRILQAVQVTAAGFLMLDLTFLLYFLIFEFFGLFVSDAESAPGWIQAAGVLLFLAVLTWLGRWIFNSRIHIVIKAAFVMVPTAVIIVFLGIIFVHQPVWSYVAGALASGGILAYFWRKRKPWLYSYSVILVTLGLMILDLTGGEI